MIRIQDEVGNTILVENAKGYHGHKLLLIYLRLASENHRRHIGTVNTDTRAFHVERSTDMHLLKKANAYGFNHSILKNAKTFDHVVLHETDSKRIYKMERKHILNEGEFLFFKQQGYERQIFLTVEWIQHYEITVPAHRTNLINEYRVNV